MISPQLSSLRSCFILPEIIGLGSWNDWTLPGALKNVWVLQTLFDGPDNSDVMTCELFCDSFRLGFLVPVEQKKNNIENKTFARLEVLLVRSVGDTTRLSYQISQWNLFVCLSREWKLDMITNICTSVFESPFLAKVCHPEE